jgi:hypothetical protein
MSRLPQIRDPEVAHLPDRRTSSLLRGSLRVGKELKKELLPDGRLPYGGPMVMPETGKNESRDRKE